MKLSGSREDEDTRSVRSIIAGRLPWLTINLMLDVVAVSVVAYFESVIQAVVAISVLLPIISDMGGNTGIQALSVAIRKLATGRVDFSQFWPVFRREALAALVHGMLLGLLIGVVAWWWKGIPALGLVAGLALWVNTIVAGVSGALIPLVLHRLRLDPASSSGPILTTITDMTGFFMTLKLASLLMKYLVPAAAS
jgi:magnesium transporter